jgi:hypothetical protein
MKEIRKTEKGKKKRKENTKRAPGNQSSPAGETTHGPPRAIPNRYPLSLFLSLTAGPTYHHLLVTAQLLLTGNLAVDLAPVKIH